MKKENSRIVIWGAMFFLIFMVSSIVLLASVNSSYKIIVTPLELTEVLLDNEYTTKESKEMMIIDLRDREDYEAAHIVNSINIPYNDGGVLLIEYLKKKDYRNKEVYLICYSGKRSAQAFNQLTEARYKKINYIRFGVEEYMNSTSDSELFQAGKCKCEDED